MDASKAPLKVESDTGKGLPKKRSAAKPLQKNRSPLVRKRKRLDWQLLVLLAPGIIWLILFSYVPMSSIRMAFYNYNVFKGFSGSTMVGLENFKTLFTGADFPRALRNTLAIGALQLLICFPFPIFLAIIINEVRLRWLGKLTQTLTFIPYFISTVVVVGMVVSFCSPSTGIVNLILKKLGFDPVYFLVQSQYFRPIYIIMTLWQSSGFNAIVYIAALAGIDKGLYEAADVDGATRLQQIWHITLPGIRSTIVVMLILNVGNIIKVGYEAIMTGLVSMPLLTATPGMCTSAFPGTTGDGMGAAVPTTPTLGLKCVNRPVSSTRAAQPLPVPIPPPQKPPLPGHTMPPWNCLPCCVSSLALTP